MRTLPRALTIGVVVVTICYIGLNAVYLYVLPLDAVRRSPRIAADVAQVLVGSGAASAVSALVVLSAVGALTGIILGGPRMYLSMAQDGLMLKWVGAVHPTYRTPHRAIVLQAVWASVLVLTGSYPTLFGRVIYMEWFFFALMTAGVFVLRRRPGYQPAYRMWGYPLTPALFILASAAIVRTSCARNRGRRCSALRSSPPVGQWRSGSRGAEPDESWTIAHRRFLFVISRSRACPRCRTRRPTRGRRATYRAVEAAGAVDALPA